MIVSKKSAVCVLELPIGWVGGAAGNGGSTMSIHGNAQGVINNLSPSHDCWLPTSQRELRHVERKSRLISARQNRQTNKKKKMPSVRTNDYKRSVHTESGKMWHFDLFVDVLPVVLAAAGAST